MQSGCAPSASGISGARTRSCATHLKLRHADGRNSLLKHAVGSSASTEKGQVAEKKGRYKRYWCDSSYELAFVIYALDEGMWFERNWNSFPYTFEGRERRWIPDFRLKDGTYLEIKGYTSPQAEAKFAAFSHGLIIVKWENMKFVFEHVVKKYGRDFIRLYE
jgi:hypothetical protein